MKNATSDWLSTPLDTWVVQCSSTRRKGWSLPITTPNVAGSYKREARLQRVVLSLWKKDDQPSLPDTIIHLGLYYPSIDASTLTLRSKDSATEYNLTFSHPEKCKEWFDKITLTKMV